MEYLGIAEYDGVVYESGNLSTGYRLTNAPLILPVRFDNDTQQNSTHSYKLFFREDSYDPITRIRRGRIYRNGLYSNPSAWHVHDPSSPHLRKEKWGEGIAQVAMVEILSTNGYDSSAFTKNKICILGATPHETYWKLISIEKSMSGADIYTIKSYRSLGETPVLNMNNIPERVRHEITEAIERVDNSVNRQDSASVVDCCRDALAIIFNALIGRTASTKKESALLDLGHAVNEYANRETVAGINRTKKRGEDMLSSAGRIVARFHSRSKYVERLNKTLRHVAEEDAQLALRCLGFCLVELEWANEW